jgi:hypothetical protein
LKKEESEREVQMDKEKTFKIDKKTRKLLEQIEKELKESVNKSLFNKDDVIKECVYKPNDEMEYIAIEIEIEDDKPTKS